ncbi:potassium voltage-gated channel protein Shaw-like [Ruditapes philippinarum]|uniref:potassium voltage-gated channel protein Shaw-like n=1 Tax=Ruditapes philippinarum TaxID=129788 RepID=UPI00295B558F|nr:potassium voltage-gated channel protein Shaw-like [Ruditapes philippinarum]
MNKSLIRTDEPVSPTKERLKTIILNISGTRYEVSENTWTSIKKNIPVKFRENLHQLDTEIYIERHPAAFQSILYYEQGGELHLPSDLCPSSFKKELEFWGVDEVCLAKCCFTKYIAYFDDSEVLKILEFDENKARAEKLKLMNMSASARGWRRLQGRMWLILNEPFYSKMAKVYFIFSAILITVSLFALIAGTHHSFQRPLNIKEWQIYYGDEWYKYKSYFLGNSEPESTAELEETSEPESTAEPEVTSEPESTAEPEVTSEPESTAEPEVTSEPESTAEPEVTSEPTAEPEVTSEPESTAEPEVISEPEVTSEPASEENEFAAPENAFARYFFLDILEFTCIALFTLDLIVRLIFCPFRFQLIFSFLHWVDVFALAVMYLKYTIETIFPKEKYEASVLDILHCLQIVRIFRLFRLVKNFIGFRVLLYAFKASFKELMLMSLFLFVAMLVFSTFVFFSGDDNFPNIPDSFWWAIVTMTTVGYGDVVPKTTLSKTVGVFCAISGVCLIAVIIPIFVNNFMLFYTYSKVWGKRAEKQHRDKPVKITQVLAVDAIKNNLNYKRY